MKTFVVALRNWVFRLSRPQKFRILILTDICLIPLSFVLAMLIDDPGLITLIGSYAGQFLFLISVMIAVGLLATVSLALHRIKLNAYEQSGIVRTATFAAVVGIAGSITLSLLSIPGLGAETLITFAMILGILAVSARFILRTILLSFYRSGEPRQRVLIYGAGQTGVQLAAALRTDDTLEPIAFVDDNPTLHKVMVAGLPVHAPVRIEQLIEEKLIDRVVLAMPSISRPKQARIAKRLQEVGCEVSMLPSFSSLVGEGELLDNVQPVNPSHYLNREGLDETLRDSSNVYADKSIMITGAGGSIGSELTRQVLRCAPRRVVLFEISEFALYQLNRELLEIVTDETEIVPLLGSVTDADGVRRAVLEYEVEVIIHAAAYKHVPLVEKNQLAGLRNNVLGTRVMAEAARQHGVERFILVSTDKAVRPTNVMGASKRFAEFLVQDLASRSSLTRYSIVRFGNVLGSSGSVVPLFEEQIARGGPVTLTHAEVTRYFMTLSEAARLVLLAGSYVTVGRSNNSGEIFVLDMGTPVPILKLARQMIEQAGYSVCDTANPEGDIEIVITGLRPGEKLHEELTQSADTLQTTEHPKIMKAHEPQLSELEMAAALQTLSRAIETGDTAAALTSIRHWVGSSLEMSASVLEPQDSSPAKF